MMIVEDLFYLIVVAMVPIVLFDVIVGERRLRRGLSKYWSRPCTGRQWRLRFPDSHVDEIRIFLHAFIDAYGFDSSRRLKFAPGDKVMDVYRTLYPSKYDADGLELECFRMNLDDLYGAEFPDCFTENTTLGDLFQVLTSKGNRN